MTSPWGVQRHGQGRRQGRIDSSGSSKMSDARQREQSPGTSRAGVARQRGQEHETRSPSRPSRRGGLLTCRGGRAESSVTHRDLTPVRPDVTANTGRVQRDAQPSGNGTFRTVAAADRSDCYRADHQPHCAGSWAVEKLRGHPDGRRGDRPNPRFPKAIRRRSGTEADRLGGNTERGRRVPPGSDLFYVDPAERDTLQPPGEIAG